MQVPYSSTICKVTRTRRSDFRDHQINEHTYLAKAITPRDVTLDKPTILNWCFQPDIIMIPENLKAKVAIGSK
jgi:hypothetical protein